MPGSASQDDRRISLEGELTDEIKIDTSLIPEHVRMHLAAKTLECFKAFLAVPGNAEWLDEQVATMKAAEAAAIRKEKMAYYRTCPYCGSNNDPGETCDCRAETKKEPAPAQRERTQANGYPYTVYQPGRAASRTKEVRPWLKS